MGMYTELYFRAALKKNTPSEVIDTLKIMVDGPEEDVQMPFEGPRARWMFRSASHYHHPYAMGRLDYAGYCSQWYLLVRCDLKNYDNEIGNFLQWIKPHLDCVQGHYLGHHFYEEADLPTPIIMGQF